MKPGVLVVDGTFLRHLASEEDIKVLEGVCRVSSLQVAPSVINVVEATKTSHPERRIRLLLAIEAWAGSRPVLPWPREILRRAALAALEGRDFFEIEQEGLDWLSIDLAEIEAAHKQSWMFAGALEEAFQAPHAKFREEGQRLAKRDRLTEEWPTPETFMDYQWTDREAIDHAVSVLWEALSLPGQPQHDLIATVEPWRIMIDAMNYSFYDRIIKKEQTRNPAGFMDLMQLQYLSKHRRARFLVTNDVAFAAAARSIMVGRYPNCRVLSAEELLGSGAA